MSIDSVIYGTSKNGELDQYDKKLESETTRMPVKTSIGIILCRRNEVSGRPEVLLAHKRYTYAFTEFVHGHYIKGRTAYRSVAILFNSMTREELFDILSLNFKQMWYRIWLTYNNSEFYNKKYAKYQSTFMRDDGGAALRSLVMDARINETLLWEVPKGRHLNSRESDILCATREFLEETGIEKSEYQFLPGVKRRVNYVSSGTRYICIYYIAIVNSRIANFCSDPSRSTLRELNLMAEVSEICWHDIEKIRFMGGEHALHLESLVSPAFKLMKKYTKGRWASRKHTIHLPIFK